MSESIAPVYTRVPASSTAQLISNGETIKIYGILIAASGVSTTSILERDGTTVIASVTTLANQNVEIRTDFIAKNGLSITTSTGVAVTVFHSNAAA